MRFEGETRSRFEYRPDWLNDKLINLSGVSSTSGKISLGIERQRIDE